MDILRQSLAITFVLGLLCLALWLLKRRGAAGLSLAKGRGGRGLLESRGKLALTPQHSLHVVRIGERDFVLAVHPAGVTLLSDSSTGTPAGQQL
jgi:flagellar biosynthetic protein FliO